MDFPVYPVLYRCVRIVFFIFQFFREVFFGYGYLGLFISLAIAVMVFPTVFVVFTDDVGGGCGI